MLLTTWAIMAANLLLHQGWIGALGQVIGSDFITLYAAGVAYRTGILTSPPLASLYDFEAQGQMQSALIAPTSLPGINPYISPPYVAYVYSLLTYLPLPWAFLLWSVIALIFAALAVKWLVPLLPGRIKAAGLGYGQMLVLVLSFFPFIEGFQVGQNHTLTLLLITGILAACCQTLGAAGALAGCYSTSPSSFWVSCCSGLSGGNSKH
jgi:hypothetical protein